MMRNTIIEIQRRVDNRITSFFFLSTAPSNFHRKPTISHHAQVRNATKNTFSIQGLFNFENHDDSRTDFLFGS